MTLPLVSIAIPTYNRADQYLSVAVKSAIAQTYENLEIIVSDNCSSDHTSDLVRTFDDNRIKYIRHEENIGANNNFNYCLNNSSGKYFMLLSDDDLIAPEFVERCVSAINHQPGAGMVRSGTAIIDSTGNVTEEQPIRSVGKSGKQWIEAWFNHETSLYLCSTLFDRDQLIGVGGFNTPQNLFQDVAVNIMLAMRSEHVEIPDCLSYFRIHCGETTHSAGVQRWCEDSDFILNLLEAEIPDYDNELKLAARVFFTRFNYKRVRGLPSFVSRLGAYWSVYQRYGKVYSPLRFRLENTPLVSGHMSRVKP